MQIIAERTDGVPLFVEELTKTILESGSLKDDGTQLVLNGPLSTIAIPTTLHDSLMARLDRLQPIKEVAQTAACIGREFTHGLLEHISNLSDVELSSALEGLIAAELIYPGACHRKQRTFSSMRCRDAAYESFLKKRRRAIHARIFSALEGDTGISPAVLAFHVEVAGRDEDAAKYWHQAGLASAGQSANAEALIPSLTDPPRWSPSRPPIEMTRPG